jgi:NADH-quinone oxidoreductase subunit A
MNDISFLTEYFPILVFIVIAAGLSIAMVAGSWLAGIKRPDKEKLLPYECGFDAFEGTGHKFDIRFYLVAILFIIFDLEIAFLFPWAISLGETGAFAFWSMMSFLGILTVGFIYEWKKGALDWE